MEMPPGQSLPLVKALAIQDVTAANTRVRLQLEVKERQSMAQPVNKRMDPGRLNNSPGLDWPDPTEIQAVE